MRTTVHPADFTRLRDDIAELQRQWTRGPMDRVGLPPIPGGFRDDRQAVELGDALTVALGAVAGASRRLRSASVEVDLGHEPLTLELVGELAGTSSDAAQIFVRVRPERGGKHARQA